MALGYVCTDARERTVENAPAHPTKSVILGLAKGNLLATCNGDLQWRLAIALMARDILPALSGSCPRTAGSLHDMPPEFYFEEFGSWKECSVGLVNGVGMPPDHGSIMVPDVRLPALTTPVPLDGAEGHEALAALDEQHKHVSAEDGSGLHDPSVGMQVLSVDQISTSGVVALKLVRGHDPGAVAAGLMEPGVVGTGDDGSSALPALRLCAHGKSSRNECDECIKALALQMQSTPNALEQESGKKRPRDDLAGCSKGETADIMKTASVALASCATSELLSPHTTGMNHALPPQVIISLLVANVSMFHRSCT